MNATKNAPAKNAPKTAMVGTGCSNAYAKRLAEVELALRDVAKKIASHKKQHAADPANWGYVGDLEKYLYDLNGILGRNED